MSILCFFRQCRWVHVANVTAHRQNEEGVLLSPTGLWQCSCCKTMSIGRAPDAPAAVVMTEGNGQ